MNKNKIVEKVLTRISAHMEAYPTAGWVCPFGTGRVRPYNAVSGRPYSGINFLMLMGENEIPAYMTFNQAKKAGFHVRKGASGYPIVFYKMIPKRDKETDEPTDKFIPLMKLSYVFNVADIEGIDLAKYMPERKNISTIESCEKLTEKIQSRACDYLHTNRMEAFYDLLLDTIHIPAIHNFIAPEHYYSTLWHEMAHSTGASHRLNRFSPDESPRVFGDTAYAKEELIAEFTAAMLMYTAGIESVTPNHAAHIKSWLARLKNNPAMLIPAASAAGKAYDYLMNEDSESSEDNE